LAAALCIGVGCVGPSVGQSIFAHASCKAIGLNKNIYRQLFTFSMVNQAIIETPLIFCLLSAILIIFNPLSASNPFGALIGMCAAAFCIAVGSFGTATGSGLVGSKSCEQMAIEPESYAVLFRSTILAQSFIQSAVIYALIVTLYLITRSY